MRKDYKVRPRTRETIKGFAEDIRLRATVATTATCFSLMDVLRQMQSGRVLRKGSLIITPFTQGDGDPPAFVKYNPLRLFIDHDIERELELNEPMARFIASHEIGHIFMHDREPQQFSGERQRWIDFEEESAEWQANTFADYFLLPDSHMGGRLSPSEIAINYAVPIEVVQRRFQLKRSYVGDPCPECGNFTLRRRGVRVSCETCFLQVEGL